MAEMDNAAASPQQTLGILAESGKIEAEQTIAQLQAMLAAAQTQHAAVLGRYVGLMRDRSDVVPEMIGGETLDEVDASLAQSRAAFERLASRFAPSSAANGDAPNSKTSSSKVQPANPTSIPAGGAARQSSSDLLAMGARQLSPFEKIRLGLENSY